MAPYGMQPASINPGVPAMSAFLCSDRHIAHIVAWAYERGLTRGRLALACSLRRLNNAALAHRYGAGPVRFSPGMVRRIDFRVASLKEGRTNGPTADAMEARALLDCLVYQCSEGGTLDAHPDAPALLRLHAAAVALTPFGGTPGLWDI